MRVLLVGPDWYGSNARSLADGFRYAGAEVLVVDTTVLNRPTRFSLNHLRRRLGGRVFDGLRERVLQNVQEAAGAWSPDIVIGFKTIHLDQERLLSAAPRARWVHYSADDVSNPANVTPDYMQHERGWDLIVTTKSFNVAELRARGARDVLYVKSAYDPALHHPKAMRSAQTFLVGFVGNARPDRTDLMSRLGERYGRDLLVAGPGWGGHRRQLGHAVVRSAVYGEQLSATIASVSANLVLLNSDNRDLHTCRSFEVPAMGGLVVAQDTPEHRDIFVSGKEALLFSSEAELVQQLEFVRSHPSEAKSIARAGFRAVAGGHHTYADRAVQIIKHIDN